MIRQGVILVDEPDLVTVLLDNLCNGVSRALTIRTLEVRELDNDDRGIGRTP